MGSLRLFILDGQDAAPPADVVSRPEPRFRLAIRPVQQVDERLHGGFHDGLSGIGRGGGFEVLLHDPLRLPAVGLARLTGQIAA